MSHSENRQSLPMSYHFGIHFGYAKACLRLLLRAAQMEKPLFDPDPVRLVMTDLKSHMTLHFHVN
jgi:hypothetical protein